MQCSDVRGEQYAAREGLAVSENQLQRVKQKGCEVASASDRAVYTLPNYKAMPWPIVSGPDITLEYDPNNMDLGRGSIYAAEFTEPFVGGPGPERKITHPAYGPTGTAFAGSGNLLATEAASFASSDLPDPPLYQQLASSIKMNYDNQPLANFVQTAPASLSQQKLGTPLETFTPAAGTPLPIGAAAESIHLPAGKNASVYGAANNNEEGAPVMYQRIIQAIKGTLYDLVHFQSINQKHLDEENCSCKVAYAFTRDGRLPYLAVAIFSFLFLLMLLSMVIRACT